MPLPRSNVATTHAPQKLFAVKFRFPDATSSQNYLGLIQIPIALPAASQPVASDGLQSSFAMHAHRSSEPCELDLTPGALHMTLRVSFWLQFQQRVLYRYGTWLMEK